MKNYIVLLLLILTVGIESHSQSIVVNDNSRADSLLKASYAFYDSKPEKFIVLNEAALSLYKKTNSKKKMAQVYRNLAFVYTEKIKDYELANINISWSIDLWQELKEPLDECNLLKYRGMINAYLQDYNRAKKDIRLAIKKYKALNYANGIYISYLDLAIAYEQEGKVDSCIYYANINKDYFTEKKDTSRIFIVNNKLIHYYLLLNEYAKAKQIVRSSKQIISSEKVSAMHKEEFKNICRSSNL